MPSAPLPSQSAATGVHPGPPYANGVISGAPGPFVFRKYHVAVAGLNTPIESLPSPSQSPTTGIHPAPPYANGVMSGAPGVLLLRRYHVAVAGLNTPTVIVP